MMEKATSFSQRVRRALAAGQVEQRGIQPIPLEERTSTQYFRAFTIWFSINTNILAITFGMLGPVSFNLGLRDSAMVILSFSLISTFAPAYLSVLGPQTGMRQMVQARYSFGRHLCVLPIVLNLATLIAFCVIMSVIGGDCLSATSDGSLSPTLGIVLIALVALFISFWGFNVMHFFETYAWMPSLAAIIVAVGYGGSQLKQQAVPPVPAASQILSFGAIIASYIIPWACVASDLTTYFSPSERLTSGRVFVYSYLGILIPTVLLMTLGAAIGGAMPNIPEWEEGFGGNQVGGIFAAILDRAGGFGKFLLVILAFSLLANVSGTMYVLTLNFQNLLPVRIPRYVYAVVVAALLVPLGIEASKDFFHNVEHLAGLIGYWSAAFVSIVLVEHSYFRRSNSKTYDPLIWNTASALPSGFAAVGACILAFGLVIPCMAQAWWTGPIAENTGDIGFEVAFFLSGLLYVPLRVIERQILEK
ncbi:NCS1 nucleoside transporter [Decorospora gaudefroyi]|uniref:NCS1 nucleoside transporter n=1 Tax=Decorospora gaudefroyi TaxID=184978 RepID=A0A6A5KHB0_9PLEO|nr:NCS1 nucleoside transporter [Decorospora gaudefroyi]